ncbi:hypothetical protein [Actinoplanes palleronii]|uniref:Secreted protein n=1 Tax=Actinoplanes palleronii TaxID=113570 RepID=A0ABQ4BTH4_9ACTN|nr:hypothetical protein [Actinoplanes palleronii]GIE73968.1 hypothetical protein Apa02nite_100760 [Actinoplanes palleronii]
MSTRRVSSRKVVLTATFLALAVGGTAACDNSSGEEWEYTEEPAYTYDSGSGGTVVKESVTEEETLDEEPSEEVFYCADEEGEVVDEEYCDDDTGSYFIWHSTSYSRGLGPGAYLDGGDYFSPGDTESRRAFALPTAGRLSNGTVKTNVVGRGSSGSTAGGTSSSGG